MLRIQTAGETRWRVTLIVEGELRDEHLAPLREAIVEVRSRGRQVWLDLEAVELVGRRALEYLAATVGRHVRVERCPAYLWSWMERERAHQVPSEPGAAPGSDASPGSVPRQRAGLRGVGARARSSTGSERRREIPNAINNGGLP